MSTPASPEWKKTACIICSLNCGLEVQTEQGRITLVRGDKAHPTSQGYLCEKAQRLDFYQNGADRIDSPKRRRPDGTYENIDWPTAIGEIAQKLSRTTSLTHIPNAPPQECPPGRQGNPDRKGIGGKEEREKERIQKETKSKEIDRRQK